MICAVCGQENPEGSVLRGVCRAVGSARAAAEERKVVTALFCDLVGFTALVGVG